MKLFYPLAIIYPLMLLVIFILPYFSTKGYSIITNTTSELGAQNTPNAWAMNTIFVLLGLSAIITAWRTFDGLLLHKIILLVFGISLILTAYFRLGPIEGGDFNTEHARLHSVFASSTGFAFTILAIATAFVVNNPQERFMAITAAVLATVLSMLMFSVEGYRGIWQRGIFILCFAWLLFHSYQNLLANEK